MNTNEINKNFPLPPEENFNAHEYENIDQLNLEIEESYWKQQNANLDALVNDVALTNKDKNETALDWVWAKETKKTKYTDNPFWTEESVRYSSHESSSKLSVISTMQLEKMIDKDKKKGELPFSLTIKNRQDHGLFVQLAKTGIDFLPHMGMAAKKVFSLIALGMIDFYDNDSFAITISEKQMKGQVDTYRDSKRKIENKDDLKQQELMDNKEFLRFIAIPEDYNFSSEIYKKGIQELTRVSIKAKKLIDSQDNISETKKMQFLFKTKSRGYFYINFNILFHGKLTSINKLKTEERRDDIKTCWNDKNTSVDEYLAMIGQIKTVRNYNYRFSAYEQASSKKRLIYNQTIKKNIIQNSAFDIILNDNPRTVRRPFVKIYREGIFKIFTLGKNGMLVFTDILNILFRKKSADTVTLHYTDKWFYYQPKNNGKMENSTGRKQAFHKGIQECLEHGLICRVNNVPNTYFINPLFFFVGDRQKLKVSKVPAKWTH